MNTGFDGTTTYYYTQPTDDIQTAAGPVMTAVMKATKNDLSLQGKKWTLHTGTSVQPNSPSLPLQAARLQATGDGSWQPTLQNTDEVSGLTAQIQVLIRQEPAPAHALQHLHPLPGCLHSLL